MVCHRQVFAHFYVSSYLKFSERSEKCKRKLVPLSDIITFVCWFICFAQQQQQQQQIKLGNAQENLDRC